VGVGVRGHRHDAKDGLLTLGQEGRHEWGRVGFKRAFEFYPGTEIGAESLFRPQSGTAAETQE
jgi:hypothetical protein